MTVTDVTDSPVIAVLNAEGRAGTKLNPCSKSGPARTGLGVVKPAAWLSLTLSQASGPLGSGIGGASPRSGWTGHLRVVGALGALTAALMWAKH